MRILLDTNVIIPLEDSSRALEPYLARLHQLSVEHNHQLFIHPASITDINRDRNQARCEITKSRLARYPAIDTPPRLLPEKPLQELNNDEVDDEILYSLNRNAASVLVTEDRGIHRKAIACELNSRVLYVQQAVVWLERLHATRGIAFPNIQDAPIHTLNLADSFFDSLRAGYSGFDAWFERSAQNGRRAWVYKSGADTPVAICIYKIEQSPVVTDSGIRLSSNVLKLCTFKVAEDVRGRRIGELFFKAAFKYAFENNLEHVYLTMVRDQGHLKDLCLKYGFIDRGPCSDGRELVMAKDIPQSPPISDLPSLEYHVRYSPCFKVVNNTRILLVPIQPRYHNLLFPEIGNQLELFTDGIIGNGLTLAYLCHAKIKEINSGDVVLFYRSDDLKQITTLGIVETALITNEVDEITRNVAKRTVYALPEIESMAIKPVRVILFRLATHLPNKPEYSELLRRKIVTGPIQSIRNISKNAFQEVINISGITSCLFAD